MTFDRWRTASLTALVLLISSSVTLPLVADDCSGVAAYASGTVSAAVGPAGYTWCADENGVLHGFE